MLVLWILLGLIGLVLLLLLAAVIRTLLRPSLRSSYRPDPDPARAAARGETDCSLPELCAAAAYLLGSGGRFCLVYRPERLSELFCALSAAGLEPKRLRLVCPRPESAPSLVLAEARRGGRPGLAIEPPLTLTDGEGRESEEVKRIYHREEDAKDENDR